MAEKKSVKADRASKSEATETKVVYLNLPLDLAEKLQKEAEEEERPMSVQAARIIRKHFESKK